MTKIKTLGVDLGERSYDIHIGTGLVNAAGNYLKDILPIAKVVIVTDKVVADLHLERLQQALADSGIAYDTIVLEAGEQSKSFAVLESLLDRIFAFQPERNITLIALGGGVIGDLTGFAASILLRGVGFVQIPTTLLSQVDSSVGGKTGINNSFGKNLVGSFYQPRVVLADIEILASLPEREFLSGYAEIVKYGLINNEEFFLWLDDNKEQLGAMDSELLAQAIYQSCLSKAQIVSADEKEKGQRALLNLGHTFGHALELDTGYGGKLLHGEAVAVGMVLAFRLSHDLGLCSGDDVQKVEQHLRAMGLATSLKDIDHDWDASRLVDYMYQDKKVSDGKLVFILAKGIGHTFIKKDVDREAVYSTLNNDILS